MNRFGILSYDYLVSDTLTARKVFTSFLGVFWTYDLSGHRILNSHTSLAIIGPYGRQDYYRILDSYIDQKTAMIDLYRTDKKLALPDIKEFLSVFKRYNDISIGRRIYISLRAVHYGLFRGEVRFLKCNHYRSVVFFSASHPHEATIAEYLGGCTHRISLQHAFYRDFRNENIDSLPYVYMPVDELWVWGSYHKKIFASIFHRLNIQERPPLNIELPRNILYSENKDVLVLLPRKSFTLDNVKLLSILKNYLKLNFRVKVHPKDSREYYYKMFRKASNISFITSEVSLKNNPDLSTEYGFAITFNSTSYIDCYYSGLRCLYFENGESDFSFRVHNSDCFCDIDTFISCVDNLGDIDTELMKEMYENLSLVYAV